MCSPRWLPAGPVTIITYSILVLTTNAHTKLAQHLVRISPLLHLVAHLKHHLAAMRNLRMRDGGRDDGDAVDREGLDVLLRACAGGADG